MELPIGMFDVKNEEAAKAVYANYVQFVVTNTDVMLDFFLLSPSQISGANQLAPVHILRVALPLTLIKGFVSGLANAVAGWEDAFKISLPNSRAPAPDDKIQVWP
jgi:hypothetical protein